MGDRKNPHTADGVPVTVGMLVWVKPHRHETVSKITPFGYVVAGGMAWRPRALFSTRLASLKDELRRAEKRVDDLRAAIAAWEEVPRG